MLSKQVLNYLVLSIFIFCNKTIAENSILQKCPLHNQYFDLISKKCEPYENERPIEPENGDDDNYDDWIEYPIDIPDFFYPGFGTDSKIGKNKVLEKGENDKCRSNLAKKKKCGKRCCSKCCHKKKIKNIFGL